jgi:WD40 repeat protein
VEKNIPYTYSSDEFNKIYNLERLYGTKEKLAAILSQYDLERLDELRGRFIETKGHLDKKKYILTGPGKDYKGLGRFAQDYFLPNRQFSYLIYYVSGFPYKGILIDLNTKEISFPFGLDELTLVTWNKEGQYVAYSNDERDSSESVLVIKDISKQKTLLRKNLGNYISNMTWSPDSSSVALLTYTSRLSLSPWDLLAAACGHRIFFKTFYLKVYDLSGNLIYSQKINGEFKFSRGRLVWIP